MNSLRNSVQLIGNLGKDPEITKFDNGNKLAKFTLATSDYYKNKDGEKVQETQWHNLIAWGKLAENMDQILSKGSRIVVQGKLVNRSYDDKEGNKRYVTEIVARNFVNLTKKESMPF